MRVVALISGGKDSNYNLLQCVAAGHEIVALANLQPRSKGKCYNDFVEHYLRIAVLIQFCDSFRFYPSPPKKKKIL